MYVLSFPQVSAWADVADKAMRRVIPKRMDMFGSMVMVGVRLEG